MHNVFKKIAAVALSACMAASLCVTALAAETTTPSDTGTITVSGLESGVTVHAYQIAKGVYDTDSADPTNQFVGYEMLYNAGNFKINEYGGYDEDTLTEANLAALYNAAVAGEGEYTSVVADADGVATFSDMEIGSYLFVVTGSESTVYGMVIGSTFYVVDEVTGEWAVSGGTVAVDGDNLWVKSTVPQIEKTETGGSLTGDDYEHGNSADLGDTLEYHITVGPVPSYVGDYPEFKVTDVISDELEITDDELAALTITVVGGEYNGTVLTKDTDYTVEKTATGFVVDFVVNGAYTLNDYVGSDLLIDFQADVVGVGDAAADDDDHMNTATLLYTTTSYVTGEDINVDDTDHDYTFNVKIKKVDQDNAALANSTFTLYTDETCETPYQQNGANVTATSGEDGYFEFQGLEEGTYYMKETQATNGYALNTEIYKITITAFYAAEGSVDPAAGTLTGFTIVVTDSGNNTVGSATVSGTTATITNNILGELPSMGGTGTTILMIAGALVIAIGVVGVVAYRKRTAA